MAAAHFSRGGRRAALVAAIFVLLGFGFSIVRWEVTCTFQAEAEVQKHLNRLNKPAIKSIQSPDGDIIDCVHISHQPALDHPFLKDHKIQMRPSYHPEGLYEMRKK
ncbi:hypothetical protein LguiB_032046 [Lonicera macranthoides]